MKTNKITAMLCLAAMLASFSACGDSSVTENENITSAEVESETVGETAAETVDTETAAEETTSEEATEEETTVIEETTVKETTTAEQTTRERTDKYLKDTNDDNYIYAVYQHHAEIIEYIGEEADVTIPDEYDGLPITALSKRSFEENNDVVSVVIPGTIETIAVAAFESCESLKSVVIQEGVTKIGVHAFANTSWLETAPKAINGNKIKD